MLQGDVYMKFADQFGAGRAQTALHGRFFDGRQIAAEYKDERSYTTKFPDAMGAGVALVPP